MKTKLYSKTSMTYLKHFILTFFIFSTFLGFSQTDSLSTFKSNLDLGADFKSRYIWRGINLGGNTPSIQPYVEFSFAKGWAIGTWGAFSFGEQATQEVDLYLTYTTPNDMFSFILTDYYFPDYSIRQGNFFHLDDSSGHVLELGASFNGTEKFPIAFAVYTNIIGADKKINDDGSQKNEQSFSTYMEVSYATSVKTVDLNFFAGYVLNNKGGYYGSTDSSFINIGLTASKAIKITEHFSLPVDTSLIFNPDDENVFIVFGLTI